MVAPVEVFLEAMTQVVALDYRGGGIGITAETADALDAILDSHPSTRAVRVDRLRIDESSEAWVYVTIDAPESDVARGRFFAGTLRPVLEQAISCGGNAYAELDAPACRISSPVRTWSSALRSRRSEKQSTCPLP